MMLGRFLSQLFGTKTTSVTTTESDVTIADKEAEMPKLKIALVSAIDGTDLPTTTIGDKVYFHASPESTFEVKFTIEYSPAAPPKYGKMIISLELDGESVGYALQLSQKDLATSTGYFDGFCKSIDEER
jgi:hypothetical protein